MQAHPLSRCRVAPLDLVSLCGRHAAAAGFQPNIVQEAPQWATVVSLVGAGMGVSIAPACVARLSVSGTTYRPLQPEGRSTIDVVTRTELKNPAAKTLLSMVRDEFAV